LLWIGEVFFAGKAYDDLLKLQKLAKYRQFFWDIVTPIFVISLLNFVGTPFVVENSLAY
jgi:hypothetical protein